MNVAFEKLAIGQYNFYKPFNFMLKTKGRRTNAQNINSFLIYT